MTHEENIQLMLETTKTAQEYIDKLINGINQCAEDFQTGSEKRALDITLQIIDGMKWLTEAMSLTKEIHKEEVNIQDINLFLNNIIEGFENKDYILVSDILDYEIKPIISTWKQKLAKTNKFENN